MTATCRLVKTAQPQGEYKQTALDASKENAEFLLIYIGKKSTIQWRDGKLEHVTDARLAKLQAAHSWNTNF